eukprot:scaffold12827_cov123-Isochrysis_galbana.AAC.1
MADRAALSSHPVHLCDACSACTRVFCSEHATARVWSPSHLPVFLSSPLPPPWPAQPLSLASIPTRAERLCRANRAEVNAEGALPQRRQVPAASRPIQPSASRPAVDPATNKYSPKVYPALWKRSSQPAGVLAVRVLLTPLAPPPHPRTHSYPSCSPALQAAHRGPRGSFSAIVLCAYGWRAIDRHPGQYRDLSGRAGMRSGGTCFF